MTTPKHDERSGSAAFELIEALESAPHLGMTGSPEIWNAYARLVRSLGGKPMRKWWKRRNLEPKNPSTKQSGRNG